MVDSINGRVYQLSNVPGWEDVALTALLEEWTGLPAAIDNDANAMAYAEWLYGAGRAGTNVVCVTLGTGVGGGLILDRKLYRGSRLGAGEIGQMTIDPEWRSRTVRELRRAREIRLATCRSRSARRELYREAAL
jgi:glucokinase